MFVCDIIFNYVFLEVVFDKIQFGGIDKSHVLGKILK